VLSFAIVVRERKKEEVGELRESRRDRRQEDKYALGC
jgi:hypothetical protein